MSSGGFTEELVPLDCVFLHAAAGPGLGTVRFLTQCFRAPHSKHSKKEEAEIASSFYKKNIISFYFILFLDHTVWHVASYLVS